MSDLGSAKSFSSVSQPDYPADCCCGRVWVDFTMLPGCEPNPQCCHAVDCENLSSIYGLRFDRVGVGDPPSRNCFYIHDFPQFSCVADGKLIVGHLRLEADYWCELDAETLSYVENVYIEAGFSMIYTIDGDPRVDLLAYYGSKKISPCESTTLNRTYQGGPYDGCNWPQTIEVGFY